MASKFDVVLVRMPYSELAQPSLALGLLRAESERHDVRCTAIHANLWFAEEIGPLVHELVFESNAVVQLGEWTFSGALFPDFRPDHDRYLNTVTRAITMDIREQWKLLKMRYPYLDLRRLLLEVRRRADIFVGTVADRVLELNPAIVGCTSTFQQHCASVALLQRIKEKRPDVITMIGGANCEGAPGRVTFDQYPWIDYVVSGEADGFFGSLCRSLLAQGRSEMRPDMLPTGVWGPCHRNDHEVPKQVGARQPAQSTENGPRPAVNVPLLLEGQALPVRDDAGGESSDGTPIARLDDMNHSPIPNYDDYFSALREAPELNRWFLPSLPYQTARGCWWGERHHCTFCGISRTAMKFRSKDADNVMEQLRVLRERYGIGQFQGTEYIFDYRYFGTLLPQLKKFGGRYRFEVKANLKCEQLEALAEAGVIEVQPGIESLHDGFLKLIDKGVLAYQNVLLLKRARRVGLHIVWNMLYTIPGEQDEWYDDIADLIPLIAHLEPPYGCSDVHYDRFSPYWKEADSYGLQLSPAVGYEYVYPFGQEILRETAYFFQTREQRELVEGKRHMNQLPPGLKRMIAAVLGWKLMWRGKTPPVLVANRQDGRTDFEDTRDVAASKTYGIEGVEHAVYWAAEEGVKPEQLAARAHAGGRPATETEIGDAVDVLLERKVVARVSGRIVALGMRSPVRPYPKVALKRRTKKKAGEEPTLVAPNAMKYMAEVSLDQRRRSIALDCLRPPQDEPMGSWTVPAE